AVRDRARVRAMPPRGRISEAARGPRCGRGPQGGLPDSRGPPAGLVRPRPLEGGRGRPPRPPRTHGEVRPVRLYPILLLAGVVADAWLAACGLVRFRRTHAKLAYLAVLLAFIVLTPAFAGDAPARLGRGVDSVPLG